MKRAAWLVVLFACGGRPIDVQSNAPAASRQSAKVTDDQAQRAYEIVNAIDYLPFHYTADGCYGRALYMSMELAVNQLPSSAQFIQGDLEPDQWTSWWYHVAPMLLVGDDTETTIVDPSLAAAPVPLHEWIALANPIGDYRLFWVPGSTYANDSVFENTEQAAMIESYAALPPFHPVDIADACKWMYAYIGNETDLTWDERDAKRARLIARTRQLLTQLQSSNKLPRLRTLDCGDAGTIYPPP